MKGDWHSLNLTYCKFLHAYNADVLVSIPNIWVFPHFQRIYELSRSDIVPYSMHEP